VIDYRCFRNPDLPHLVRLWHQCELGRGAASGFSTDTFDLLNMAQSYFDPRGLIVAWDGQEPVGFVHAGFGCNEDESELAFDKGVIAAVLVDPAYRRQGIGRELIRRAEDYLTVAGATTIHAGSAPPRDSFYFALYGGAEPAGFLESDSDSAPFLESLGYKPCERIAVYQRTLADQTEPVNYRLALVRRKTELAVVDLPSHPSWWWMTRLGRLDTLQFQLVLKGTKHPVAEVTAIGLDLYAEKWQERGVGLTNLIVQESERQQGYGQALVVEVMRRIRQELVTLVEAHVAESNPPAMRMFESTGFTRVDTGVVYRR